MNAPDAAQDAASGSLEMPSSDPSRPGSTLEMNLALRLLLYFDIFSHPLTRDELRSLGYPPETPDERIEAALRALVANGTLERTGDYYHLAGKSWTVAARLEKLEHSKKLWTRVPMASSVLARFPFVRGAIITGTLAKNAAGPDADIDFLVFTEPGRVWVCRTLIALFRRMLPGDLRECLCTNVFIAEDALEYDQHNMYVAVEIALSHAALNPALASRFVERNGWLRAYLPGHVPPPVGQTQKTRQPGRLERSLEGPVGDWLERRLFEAWQQFWARKYSSLPPAEIRRRFRARPELSTNHFHDFQLKTLQAYQERLEQHGLASGR